MSASILISVVLLQYVGSAFGVPRVDLRDGPLVHSKAGPIRGLQATDGDYSMFLGIPYARLEEGNIFGDSLPYPKFEEIFEAFDDSRVCPQVEDYNKTIVGTLDCLHLNVYAPAAASSTNRLPVLVFIYGGGFEYGDYNRFLYGPKLLVRHDVLLVTINYRLGPYGFMCPDIPEVPGNQGLKDQRAGLRWVKRNIEAFGGDSDQITILGESAGSASVDFHLRSTEEDLFHKVILQSGTTVSPWAIVNPGSQGPVLLAEHLGNSTDDVRVALSFLATIEPHLVIAATHELGLIFRVCVNANDDFLLDYPINLPIPKVEDIPILIGFNSDEGLYNYATADNDVLESLDFIGYAINFTFAMDDQTYGQMSKVLKQFYFGDKDINLETKREVIDLTSDCMILHPVRRSIQKYFDNGAKTIYSYLFSYVGERNYMKYVHGVNFGGASHFDELCYLFDVSFMKSVMPEEEQIIVDRMTTMWTNFAKYGNPTPEATELLPVTWIPTTEDRWNYLNIDVDMAMETRPFNQRMAFYDLFFMMNDKLQIGYKEEN